MTASRTQRSFGRVLFMLAASGILLTCMRLGAAVLNPLLLALVFSIIFTPVYAWLKRSRLSDGLALLVLLVGLVILFGIFLVVLGASLQELSSRLTFYAGELDTQLAQVRSALAARGLEPLAAATGMLSGEGAVAVVGTFAAGIASVLSGLLLILLITMFFLAEGPAILARLQAAVGADHPQVAQLETIGHSVMRQFALRAVVNAITAAGVTLLLVLLGVDLPLLWGILTFFLSYIPYIGIVVATIPSVLLAFAEHGSSTALLVIAGVLLINIMAENVVSPLLMSRGLSMSPTVVFLSFMFWTWLLGAPGAFLAMPLTFFLIVMFASFPGTRWLSEVMTVNAAVPDAAAHSEALEAAD